MVHWFFAHKEPVRAESGHLDANQWCVGLQEMQKSFNRHKSLMISINLGSGHFLHGDSAELQELREALTSANHSWTQACGALEVWEGRLHSALMQCQVRRGGVWAQWEDGAEPLSWFFSVALQEFHQALHSLLLWLAQAEAKLGAVNPGDPSTSGAALLEHRVTLLVSERL